MKKLILIAVLMLVSSSVFAQDIFGPPNYFFKRNDSVFVRPGSVFGSASSQSIDTSLIAFLNQNNTFTGAINTFTGRISSVSEVIAYSFTSLSGGGYKATAGGIFYFDTRTLIKSPADGVLSFTNNAETGFSRLQLGGTTSSFPSIKRSGAGIHIRLADDSGYGALTAASFTSDTPNGGTAGTWKLGIYKNDASSLVVSTTDYVQVDIGGTLYYLAVVK